ncbi:30S ribosomal protein S8 [bacterium]|nr:30S ribosomal protein S8 [bacterium]
MAMSDPIGDLLARIRNACMAKHRTVDVPSSKLKSSILEVLKAEGFISGYQPVEGAPIPTTRVYIRYFRREPVIQHIKRVSKPGLRRYANASEMKLVRGGLGLLIVSTPEGVITSNEARKRNVGGELLVEIW